MLQTFWHKVESSFFGPCWVLGWSAGGFIALTALLGLFLWTRWGQTRPMQKCFLLSVLLHLVLALGATAVQIVVPVYNRELPAPAIEVTLVDEEHAYKEDPSQEGDMLGDVGGTLKTVLELSQNLRMEHGLTGRSLVGTGQPVFRPTTTLLLSEDEPQRSLDLTAPLELPKAAGPPQEHETPENAALPLAEVTPQETISSQPPQQPAIAADNSSTDEGGQTSSQRLVAALLPSLPTRPAEELSTREAQLDDVFQQIGEGNDSTHPAADQLDINGSANLGTLVDISPEAGPAPSAIEDSGTNVDSLPPVEPLPTESSPKGHFPDRLFPEEGITRRVATVRLKADPDLPLSRPPLSPSEPLLPRTILEARPAPAPDVSIRWKETSPGTVREIPEPLRLRVAPNRRIIAEKRGATPATDLAVEKGLRWLAHNQDPDGRWNPRRHGAGLERYVAGRDRQGAGKDADTALTGLALLAFLGAGYTHQHGPYQETVRRGLDFLVQSQKSDGNLAGEAQYFSAMYCHAIALLALSEAYALTGAPELRDPIARAARFTVRAQDPEGGGWRYRPGDPGDTSQLGWQLLALKSAEFAGLEIPPVVYERAERFLASVSSGKAGGLAAYRAVEAPSAPMTAEALACRIFLGQALPHETTEEAVGFIVRELPGSSPPNFYFWYYATLALSQIGGPRWEEWNRALRQTLVSTQRRDYPWEGSWDPTCIWGGYGGRVYTTALAILCLETYYRYLPLLQRTESGGVQTAEVNRGPTEPIDR
ncbi:MAG: hypothetical protein RMJ16_02415 [Thermoguttaceae bacterium]|nr:hypothetical protein [Thermoguttaceae bacterium]